MDAELQTVRKYLWMQNSRLPGNINGCRVANCQEIFMDADLQTSRKYLWMQSDIQPGNIN